MGMGCGNSKRNSKKEMSLSLLNRILYAENEKAGKSLESGEINLHLL